VATDGKVCGKDGKVLMDSGHLHAANPAIAREQDERVYVCMRLFKVLAARCGGAAIELKYHEQGGVSRGEPNLLPRNPRREGGVILLRVRLLSFVGLPACMPGVIPV
jgi:hypothetical protein